MADHDFRSLNDKDFEALCVDLIGRLLGVRIERFKPGRDLGVDGRYFSPSRGEVILQSKHWPKSSVRQLIASLAKEELPKVCAIDPERYLLAVSLELSRQDKTAIAGIFAPYLKPEDVFGLEDINDLLDSHPDIERQHYKLWIRSSGVLANLLNHEILGRSQFAIEQMRQRADRYVITRQHHTATEMLEGLGVVIVSGEPGVGKTMLAEQVCLSLVADGFDFVQIHSDVHEGDSVFQPGRKQVFYFDDFLGRNYLAAVQKNEGSAITQFINRVAADKTKRLVITSRSGVLNQGRLLMDVLSTSRAKRNDFELRISNLSTLDKGRILYQHIWTSGLAPDLIEEIYKDRRYRKIVEHPNFNPRLIEFITDPFNLEQVEAADFWSFIHSSLENPSEVWAHAFDIQLDDFSRVIVFLVVVNGKSIAESRLRDAYRRFLARPGRNHLSGRQDFGVSLRVLVGSLLNRRISENDGAVDLFNPSVGDFAIGRLRQDGQLIADCLVALRSVSSLLALNAMARNGLISPDQLSYALTAALIAAIGDDDIRTVGHVLEGIFFVTSERCPFLLVERQEEFSRALDLVMNDASLRFSADKASFISWGVNAGFVSPCRALEMFIESVSDLIDDSDFRAAANLISTCEGRYANGDEAWRALGNELLSALAADVDSFVEMAEIISDHGPGEYESVRDAVLVVAREKFDDLGVPVDASQLDTALENIDIRALVDDYFANERDGDFDGYIPARAPSPVDFDELDDLFDRS